MTSQIKTLVAIESTSKQEIEVYVAFGTVRDKIVQSKPKAHTYLNFLEEYVNGAIIQHHRLQAAQAMMQRYRSGDMRDPTSGALSDDSLFLQVHMRFLDIHFYAICIDKIAKLYPKVLFELSPLFKDLDRREESRNKKRRVEHLFTQALTLIRNTRDYLEHIDEEIAGDNFAGLFSKSDQTSSNFMFGKDANQTSVDIGDLKPLKDAYEALISYINELPDA